MAPCLLWSNCPMWGSCQNILRWSPSKNYLCWLVRKIFDRCYLQEIFLSPVDWCKCCLTAFSLLTVHCLYSGIIIKYCCPLTTIMCHHSQCLLSSDCLRWGADIMVTSVTSAVLRLRDIVSTSQPSDRPIITDHLYKDNQWFLEYQMSCWLTIAVRVLLTPAWHGSPPCSPAPGSWQDTIYAMDVRCFVCLMSPNIFQT